MHKFLNYIQSLPGPKNPDFNGRDFLNIPEREQSLETRIPTKKEVKGLDQALIRLGKVMTKKWSKRK